MECDGAWVPWVLLAVATYAVVAAVCRERYWRWVRPLFPVKGPLDDGPEARTMYIGVIHIVAAVVSGGLGLGLLVSGRC